MSLVMLKNTSNPKFKYLEGKIGNLTILDNDRFAFEFVDSDGSKKTLGSDIQGRLGDLNDFRSKEVNINTGRSSYDFVKLENYLDESKLFDNSYREGIGEKISSAEKRQVAINNELTGNDRVDRDELLR